MLSQYYEEKEVAYLAVLSTLNRHHFLSLFFLWIEFNHLHKAFGTQLITLVFVAVLPVVVLYTQAMGSKEWREVNAFLYIYFSFYCCTMHLQFAEYRTMLKLDHCLSIVWKNRMHQRQPQSRFCQEFHYQLFL